MEVKIIKIYSCHTNKIYESSHVKKELLLDVEENKINPNVLFRIVYQDARNFITPILIEYLSYGSLKAGIAVEVSKGYPKFLESKTNKAMYGLTVLFYSYDSDGKMLSIYKMHDISDSFYTIENTYQYLETVKEKFRKDFTNGRFKCS